MAEDVKETQDYTKALAITAFLLAYPDEAWWQDFPAWRKAVQEVRMPQARELLGEFCDYVADLGREEYEAAYVRDFDFSQNTNLYLTNHDRTDFGKQSEEMQRRMASMSTKSCRTICPRCSSWRRPSPQARRVRCSRPRSQRWNSCAVASSRRSWRRRSSSMSH